MNERDGTDDRRTTSSATEPGLEGGTSARDDLGDRSGDEPIEDPFSAGDRTDLEAQVVEPEDDSGGLEAIVPKTTYCQRCEHFATPPTVACEHPGTAVLEVVDVDNFRVRDCPVVEQRLGEADLWDASGPETEGDGQPDPDSGGTSESESESGSGSESESDPGGTVEADSESPPESDLDA